MRPLLSKCEMFYNGDKCRALVYCSEDDDCVCMTRRKDRTRQDLREQYLLRVFLATTKQGASARIWTTSSNCDKITPGQRQVQVHLLQLQQSQGLNLLNTLAVTTTTRAPSTTAIMGPASMNQSVFLMMATKKLRATRTVSVCVSQKGMFKIQQYTCFVSYCESGEFKVESNNIRFFRNL